MIKVTEWTILHVDIESAEDAPRFKSEAAAQKFLDLFGIDGLVVGLVDITAID